MSFAKFAIEDGVALITLNSPSDYNALDMGRLDDLNRALDWVTDDPEVRAICLTGAGRGFCSGAKFGEVFDMGKDLAQKLDELLTPILQKLHEGPKPVVTAINGPAAGAGVSLAIAGDIALAARSANFRLSFVRLGAVLDGGISWLLPRTVGTARARGLALTGDPISAQTAADWGLIWQVVEDRTLLDQALELAKRLADGPPRAIEGIRSQLKNSPELDLVNCMTQENALQAKMFETRDIREGVSAFLESRKARFEGN